MKTRISFMTTVLVWCGASCYAGSISPRVDQYSHTAWTLRDGELTAYPKSIAQTGDGYLWLGTETGLFHFDGVRFVRWQPPAGSALPSESVVKLIATDDGALWIGTRNGLARWKDRSLRTYSELAGRFISTIAASGDDAVWVGTSGGLHGTALLCSVRDERVECRGQDGSLGRFVSAIYADRAGDLFVGAATGLFRWHGTTLANHWPAEPLQEIHAIAPDGRGGALMTVNRSVRRIADEGIVPLELQVNRPLRPTALRRDRQGAWWIGTQDQGLLHVAGEDVDEFRSADGLSGALVTDLLEDREGGIWVATLGGLDRFRRLPALTLSERDGLSSETVTSVLADAQRGLWIGTSQGLHRLVDNRITAVSTSEPVQSLFQDRAGALWVSSPRGLRLLHNGTWRDVKATAGWFTQALAEDADGGIWIAEQSRGVFRFDGHRVTLQITPAQLGGRTIQSLVADAPGAVWIGFFEGGVSRWADGRIRESYGPQDGLGEGGVANLRVADDGALWAATAGGLSRIHQGRIVNVRKQGGLPCDAVHWTGEVQANVWLLTSCGLARVSKESLNRWADGPRDTLVFRLYDASDGVLSAATLGSFTPKVAQTTDGRIWFSRYAGLSVVDLALLEVRRPPPPVHLEQIVVNHGRLAASDGASLPSPLEDLAIDYTATSLILPDKIRFRYRLDGHDQHWIDAGHRRQVTYGGLRPGRYRFVVTAAFDGEEWNEQGAAFAFTVLPMFYETMPFRIASVLGIVLSAWAIYRIRLYRFAADLQRRMDERLAERTRVAQELHDTLLQGAFAALMQLHVYADGQGSAAGEKLQPILSRLRSVLDESRRAIYSLRAETDVEYLEDWLARDIERRGIGASIDVRIVVEGTPRRLRPAVRDEIYRIVSEAMANAVRHSRASSIVATIQYTNREMRVSIVDDGCGIPPEVIERRPSGHWGIQGMHERAARIGGTLRMWSREHAGTEVVLVLAARVAFHKGLVNTNATSWRRLAGPRSIALQLRRILYRPKHDRH